MFISLTEVSFGLSMDFLEAEPDGGYFCAGTLLREGAWMSQNGSERQGLAGEQQSTLQGDGWDLWPWRNGLFPPWSRSPGWGTICLQPPVGAPGGCRLMHSPSKTALIRSWRFSEEHNCELPTTSSRILVSYLPGVHVVLWAIGLLGSQGMTVIFVLV